MATGPLALLARAARGSSVIDHAAPKAAPRTGAWTTLRRIVFTPQDLAQPARLYDVLYKIQDLVFQGVQPLVQNPLLSGNHVRNVAFALNQTIQVSHGLARPYQGWFCVRAVGGFGFFEEGTLAPGLTPSTTLPIIAGAAGTFDFYVF